MGQSMEVQRLQQLRRAMEQAGLQAVALNPGPTFTFLTGMSFHLMERPVVLLVPRDGEPVLVLPHFEVSKAAQIPYPVELVAYAENPAEWGEAFRKAIAALRLDGKKVGVEPRQMRVLEFEFVRKSATKSEFPDATEALASLRLRKDETEVAAMRQAVRVAQAALEALLPSIRVGATERELASALTMELLRQGSDAGLPFEPIVCAGPNSANPHATPSDRKIEPGDLLLVDWGAATQGYISDLTRTFAVQQVEAEWQKIASVVLEANAAGRAAGKPGVPCASVDKAARAVIEQAGYGQYFTHRTGHGIGMESHEEPYIRGDNMHMLYPGMAYTVEPGIYLEGRGGVRIEDNVIVTKTGVEVLSDMPRDLRIVG